jgi:TfoX/Sxy family transcriptional regulator of competence genes
MAYNLKLAERIRAELGEIPFVEKKMFGGVGFLVHGNMAVGVYKEDLIVRVPAEKNDKFLKKAGAKPMDITGRPMKGWLMVELEGCKTAKQLSTWIKEGVEFALTLPPK